MNETSPETALEAAAYASLAAMRSVHGELLKRQRETAHLMAIEKEVTAFLHCGKATGAIMEIDQDRATAQTLLDYWVTALYRATREEQPEFILDEFDSNLTAMELTDDQYPFRPATAATVGSGGLVLGTQRLITECRQRIEENRLVAVVGPDGSGKSTLLQTLLLDLQSGGSLGSRNWRYFPKITPGTNPLASLAQMLGPTDSTLADWVHEQENLFRQDALHLARLIAQAGEEPAVVVVERFEEVFTLCDKSEREAFVANLLGLIQDTNIVGMVVLAMRSDYLGQVDSLECLESLMRTGLVYVSFTTDELRAAIEEPAKLVGLKFDEGIVDRLILDVQGDPAAISLLQFTLRKLWETREGNRITWEAYNQLGGGRRALERTAEQAFNALTIEDQAEARRVFLCLVRTGFGQEVDALPVRRELLYESDAPQARIDRVLDKFIGAGLLASEGGETLDAAEITVAHAALANHWPRLVEWLAEQRDKTRRRLRLSDAAKAWRNRGKDAGALWRGSLLEEAEGYPDLAEGEAEFVQASREAVDAAEREKIEAVERDAMQARKLAAEQNRRAESEKKVRVRTQLLAIALTMLALLIGFLYLGAKSARLAAVLARQTLITTRGTQLLENDDLSGASLWFAEALRITTEESTWKGPRTREDELGTRVVSALRQQAPLLHLWHQIPSDPTADETKFVTWTAEFSPDGSRVVAARGQMESPSGDARLWNANTGEELQVSFHHDDGAVRWASFSPDGQQVATASASPSGDSGSVRLWDVREDELAREFPHQKGSVNHIAFSPNGRYLAMASGKPGSANGEVQLWDAQKQELTALSHSGPVYWVAFHPDNSMLATGGEDHNGTTGIARIWNLQDVRDQPMTEIPHRRRVNCVAFNSDGGWLVTSSGGQRDEDGEAQIWQWKKQGDDSGWELHRAIPSTSGLYYAEFSPCNRFVATAGYGGSAILWHRQTGRWLASFRHGSTVFHATFSPDGRYLATCSRDGTAKVWDLATRGLLLPPLNHAATVTRARFSPDGKRLLTVSRNFVRVWQLASPNRKPEFLTTKGDVQEISCSADGSRIVTTSERRGYAPGAAHFWENHDDEFQQRTIARDIYHASLSSDGRFVATIDQKGVLQLWSQQDSDFDPKEVARDLTEINQVSVSPEGRYVAVATGDVTGTVGRVRLWDSQTGKELQQLNVTHNGGVFTVSFDSEGTRIVTASADDTAQVWDIQSGERLGEPLHHTADVVHASFSQDDARYVVTASLDQTVEIWNAVSGQSLAAIRLDSFAKDAQFSANAHYLVAACNDGKARVWHLASATPASGSQLAALRPELLAVMEHGGSLHKARFNATGDRVVTVGQYVPTLLEDLPTNKSLAPRLAQVRMWNVSPHVTTSDQAPGDVHLRNDEARAFSQLISVRRFDAQRQSIERLKPDPMAGIWNASRPKYRAEFGAHPSWNSFESSAEECEATEQWFAAIWYLDRLIASNSEDAKLLARRARAYAELGKFKLAAKDSMRTLGLGGDARVRYRLALAYLFDHDLASYQETCSQLLAPFDSDAHPEALKRIESIEAANRAVWASVVAGDEVVHANPGQIVEISERLVQWAEGQRQGELDSPALHRFLNTLGSAYYRAGEFEHAVQTLETAETEYKEYLRLSQRRGNRPVEGKIWNWLFLAMANQRLGNTEKAAEWLERANYVIGRGTPEEYANATGVASPAWDQKLALQRLWKEAKAVCRGKSESK